MRFLVLGVGNVMFCDEGIGVHFCNYLKQNYKFSSQEHSLEFVDGGTLAMRLIPTIIEFDEVLIIDCIDADDGKIGDVYFFNYRAMPKNLSFSGSAHEVEMLQTLQFIDIIGDLPKTQILAIIPKRIEPLGFVISNELLEKVKIMEKVATDYLKKCGFDVKKVGNKTIQEVADEFNKNQYNLHI